MIRDNDDSMYHEYSDFQEWFKLLKAGNPVSPRCKIPYREWFDDYISNIAHISEHSVNQLLRSLLSPFTSNNDILKYESIKAMNERILNRELSDEASDVWTSSKAYEYYYRIEKGNTRELKV